MVAFSSGPAAVERLTRWVLQRGSIAAAETHGPHERAH